MRKFGWLIIFCGILLSTVGCISEHEELFASDLSVEEVENRMLKAVDPEGKSLNAKTSVMRLEVSTPRWLDEPLVQLVETKFAYPDKFNLTTYEDNQPVAGTIIDGNTGWSADYSARKVTVLNAEFFDLARTMAMIGNPGTKLKNIFDKIEINRCTVNGGNYYKLSCQRKNRNPVHMYVGVGDFLLKRLRANFKIGSGSLPYDSKIVRYGLYGGIRIPAEMVINSDDTMQNSKVLFYKLNIPMTAADFLPPVF